MKKLISSILLFGLAFSAMPLSAFADNGTNPRVSVNISELNQNGFTWISGNQKLSVLAKRPVQWVASGNSGYTYDVPFNAVNLRIGVDNGINGTLQICNNTTANTYEMAFSCTLDTKAKFSPAWMYTDGGYLRENYMYTISTHMWPRWSINWWNVKIDNTNPVITLNGDNEIIERFDKYEEKGASASDSYSGINSTGVITVGEVDTSIVGTNIIQYSVSDNVGNTSTVTRSVTVVDTKSPSKISNLKATIEDSKTTLSWDKPLDKDYVGVNIYRSTISSELGALISQNNLSSNFQDVGLRNDTTYYYSVESVDDQGNKSALNGISVTPKVNEVIQTIVTSQVPELTEAVVNSATSVQSPILSESTDQEVKGAADNQSSVDTRETYLAKKFLGLKLWVWMLLILAGGMVASYPLIYKRKK